MIIFMSIVNWMSCFQYKTKLNFLQNSTKLDILLYSEIKESAGVHVWGQLTKQKGQREMTTCFIATIWRMTMIFATGVLER